LILMIYRVILKLMNKATSSLSRNRADYTIRKADWSTDAAI